MTYNTAPPPAKDEQRFTHLDQATIDAVIDTLVKQRKGALSPADWGILIQLGASDAGSTFSEIDLWLEQEAGREFGDSTLRKAVDRLADCNFIEKAGKRPTGRAGPSKDVWKITESGRAALTAATNLVLATRFDLSA